MSVLLARTRRETSPCLETPDAVQKAIANIKEAQPGYPNHNTQGRQGLPLAPHWLQIGAGYHALIEDELDCKPPTTLFFSSVTSKALGESDRLDARYWQRNLERPVLFRSTIAHLLQHSVAENAVFLEVGPTRPSRAPYGKHTRAGIDLGANISDYAAEPQLRRVFPTGRGQAPRSQRSRRFPKLAFTGMTLHDLPRYPWNHSETYWYESRLSKEWRYRQCAHHDLLGSLVAESTQFEPVWRNKLWLENVPWLRDHKIQDDIVFPFAGYVGMAGGSRTAGHRHPGKFPFSDTYLSSTALVLREKPVEMMTSLRRHRLTDFLDSDWWEFTIASHNGQAWTNTASVKSPHIRTRKRRGWREASLSSPGRSNRKSAST